MSSPTLFSDSEAPVVKAEPVKPKDTEHWISELVGALTDPIIAWPGGGWENDIPDWLKSQITLERMLMNMRALHGEKPTGTDAEALAYMMPLTIERPIDRDWTDIYVYLGTKVFSFAKKEFPQDIRVDKLRDDQMRDLQQLKDWIYRKRIEARQDKDRGQRREEKEKTKQEKIDDQPPLF